MKASVAARPTEFADWSSETRWRSRTARMYDYAKTFHLQVGERRLHRHVGLSPERSTRSPSNWSGTPRQSGRSTGLGEEVAKVGPSGCPCTRVLVEQGDCEISCASSSILIRAWNGSRGERRMSALDRSDRTCSSWLSCGWCINTYPVRPAWSLLAAAMLGPDPWRVQVANAASVETSSSVMLWRRHPDRRRGSFR